jgi:hypothetical protein
VADPGQFVQLASHVGWIGGAVCNGLVHNKGVRSVKEDRIACWRRSRRRRWQDYILPSFGGGDEEGCWDEGFEAGGGERLSGIAEVRAIRVSG